MVMKMGMNWPCSVFLFWKIFFYFKTVSLYFYLGVSDNQNVIKFLQDPSSS